MWRRTFGRTCGSWKAALIRLVAHSSLIGAEITLPYAQQVLKNFIDSQARKVTIESIQKMVAEQFGLRLVEIKAKNNSRAIVYPRQIAMYLAKHMTEASLPEIGRQFGGKHHTTVLHSVEKIEEVRKNDKDLNRLINKLTEQLRRIDRCSRSVFRFAVQSSSQAAVKTMWKLCKARVKSE